MSETTFNLKNRRVKMFRCLYDPVLGPTKYPKQAWSMQDSDAVGLLTQMGVYVRFNQPDSKGQYYEHLVPMSNIQSIQLENE